MTFTTKDMYELEKKSKIPSEVLMETAGKSIAKITKNKYKISSKTRILIITYHGNNGGDGFVAARHLQKYCHVDILFLGKEEKLTDLTKINLKKAKNLDIQFLHRSSVDYNSYDIIIDAILGNGVKGEIKNPVYHTIKKLNNSKAKIISVDVPTGIDPNSGAKNNIFIVPNLIITFHAIKKGLIEYKKITEIVDIGL